MVHVPILCKDVVVDPYQVFEARRHGADAILLMLSVLDDSGYAACRSAATDLGMDVVTEVHTDEELDRAMAQDARIIGINNRDLRTLSLDLEVTERLAPRITGDRVILSESGITDHRTVRRLSGLVDGFLVGTALMREPDLAHATRALIYGVTKVCGLTRTEDAATAHALGATHGGLIFAEESPRRVDLNRAAEVRRAAPLRWVGVFVNVDPEAIVQAAEDLDLAAVQLHGEEPPELVAALRARFAGHREVWKAVRVRDAVPRVDQTGADRLVLDGHDDRMRGGTGRRFNWALLAGYPDLDRVLLSGGLTPEAVPSAEAIGTWGLDVNSGVERAPGRKDPVLVAAFLDARRGTGRRAASPR
jgi:indole-3-glycerol phosphate synthase/phosphoribosylanthranilate isomerase